MVLRELVKKLLEYNLDSEVTTDFDVDSATSEIVYPHLRIEEGSRTDKLIVEDKGIVIL